MQVTSVHRKKVTDPKRIIIPILALAFIIWLYYPIIDPFNIDPAKLDRIYEPIYEYLNPFTTNFIIVGAISVYISTHYENVLLKILFFALYLGAAAVTLVAVMGMYETWHIVYFIPQILLIIVHIYVWSKNIKA